MPALYGLSTFLAHACDQRPLTISAKSVFALALLGARPMTLEGLRDPSHVARGHASVVRSDELDVPRVQHRDTDIAFGRTFRVDCETCVSEDNKSVAPLRSKPMQFDRIERTLGVRSTTDSQPSNQDEDLGGLFGYVCGHAAVGRPGRFELRIDERYLRPGHDRQRRRLVGSRVAKAAKRGVRQPEDRLERVIERIREPRVADLVQPANVARRCQENPSSFRVRPPAARVENTGPWRTPPIATAP